MKRHATAALLALLLAALAPASAAADANGDAVQAVNRFTPANELTFTALEDVIRARQARVAALRSPLRSTSRFRRWAAVYVGHNIARSRSDRLALRPRLRDSEPSIRAMAAFALVGSGDKEAIPVLIDLLDSRRFLLLSEPPERLATAVNERLVRRTRADFGFRDSASRNARRRAIAKWKTWWRAVRRTIRWDARAQRYRWRRTGGGATALRHARRSAERARHGRPSADPFARAAPLAPATSTGAPGNESLTITVKIELHAGPGASAGNVQKVLDLAASAQNGLNNAAAMQSGRCLDLRIELRVERRQGNGRPDFHQVEVLSGKSDLLRRSHINLLPLEGTSLGRLPKPGEATKGQFHDDDGARGLGHEIMHLMGIGDEYNKDSRGYAQPWDPDSIMSSVLKGKVLQRHLDRLAELFDKDKRACEKYTLNFPSWESEVRPRTEGSGSSRRHVIGELVTAQVAADFWVNPRNGKVLPAGDTPCDRTNLTGPCPEDIDPRTGSGLSRAGEAEAVAGNAPCTNVSITHLERLFKTTVTGTRQGGRFSLKVEPGDGQRANYVCNPPATPPTKVMHLIADGMGAATNVAGETAKSFSIAVPVLGGPASADSFHFDNLRQRATGDVRVVRFE